MMGASDVVYVEKRRGPRTDPWGTPVTNLCATNLLVVLVSVFGDVEYGHAE